MRIIIQILLFSGLIFAQNSIYVNQVGYLTSGKKIALTNSDIDSFFVKSVSDNSILLKGAFTNWKNNDAHSGMDLKICDFSNLQQKGKYKIVTKMGVESFPFEISDTLFNKVLLASQKGFYFQRCGTQLYQQHAGAYQHLACHTVDANYHESTGESGFHYSIGGWHDAGDFGKYIVNAGVSVGTLLLAYEVYPDFFENDKTNIPESGNGIPDLLDEIKYEIEWMLKMQHTNGGVYTKLTTKDFPPFMLPQEDNWNRYIYEIASTATADFAAVTAKASRIFKDYDSTFSNKCLTASKNAWNFLEENSNIVPTGGFKNPEDTNTGEYGDTNDKDERIWAAIELFITTSEAKYYSYFSTNLVSTGLITGAMSWQDVKTLGYITYLMKYPNGEDLSSTLLKNSFKSYVNKLVELRNQSGFFNALDTYEYYWGSNSLVLNRAILLILAYDLFRDNEYYDVAVEQLNYILGVNPHNISFITGVGNNPLMHPHHAQSSADNIDVPVPGLMSGGPNQYLNDPLLQSLFNANTPPALCFIDDERTYSSNEIAINWNSPLVFVAGYLNGMGLVLNIQEESGSKISNGIELFPNYPNPFNGFTQLSFNLQNAQKIETKVYNSIGQKIFEIKNGFLPKGLNRVTINFNNINSSGVYFYKINGENASVIGKVVYLK